MENGQSTAAKLGLPPLTPEQQEALQKVSRLDLNLLPNALVCLGFLFVLGFVPLFLVSTRLLQKGTGAPRTRAGSAVLRVDSRRHVCAQQLLVSV